MSDDSRTRIAKKIHKASRDGFLITWEDLSDSAKDRLLRHADDEIRILTRMKKARS